MGVQNWSDNVVLAELPAKPQMKDEIQSVTEIAYDRHDCDVIMDFSDVDIVTSTSLVGLMILCKLLTNRGNKLVLYNVGASTRGIFAVTGLEGVFEFVDDKSAALASLQAISQPARLSKELAKKMRNSKPTLLVDDDLGDVMMVRRAFEDLKLRSPLANPNNGEEMTWVKTIRVNRQKSYEYT